MEISFDEIAVGDRLRVSYTERGVSEWRSSVTRSVASVVAAEALGLVWLNADGFTVAHRGWPNLRIVRLGAGE